MLRSPKEQDFPLLLEVFRGGLKLDLISREEIVLWADNIIANTEDPDYFFIEVSLSHDLNGLIEVLNNNSTSTDSPVCHRVLLGLIYHRKPIFDIDEVEKMATLVGGMASWDGLTPFENNTLYEFEDYYLYYFPDLTQLQVEMINFLIIYKAFTLENFKKWPEINEHVLDLLKEEELKVNITYEASRKAWAKKEKNRKLKLGLKKAGIIMFFLILLVLLIILFNDGSTDYFSLYFITSYFLFRGGYGWWQRRKKQ